MKLLKILILLFAFEIAFAQTPKPKISLSFPESFRANEEIEIFVSLSNLKNAPYDLKISIEKEKKVLSEIYDEKNQKWQDSFYYLKNLFYGPSFEGKFKLRMKKEFLFFEGEAEIVVKLRESGKSSYIKTQETIRILSPNIKNEEKKEKPKTQEFLAEVPKNLEKEKISPKLIAILNSIFCSLIILILKIKLKSSKINH